MILFCGCRRLRIDMSVDLKVKSDRLDRLSCFSRRAGERATVKPGPGHYKLPSIGERPAVRRDSQTPSPRPLLSFSAAGMRTPTSRSRLSGSSCKSRGVCCQPRAALVSPRNTLPKLSRTQHRSEIVSPPSECGGVPAFTLRLQSNPGTIRVCLQCACHRHSLSV